MADVKVSALPAAVLADAVAGAVFVGDSITPTTKAFSLAILRTAILAGGSGYSASDVLALGAAPAASGRARLSNTDAIKARNNAGTADVELLQLTTGDKLKLFGTWTLPAADGTSLQFLQTDGAGNLAFATVSGGGAITGSGTSGKLTRWTGSTAIGDSAGVVDADVSATAAIAYTKLSLTGHLVNADIATGAAIVYAKLSLTASIVNADIATGAAIAYAKLSLTGSILNADLAGSIAYAKLTLTGSIVNADISAGAAITYSKLALSGSIVNADVATGAAIAYAKLTLTGAIVNADVSASAAIAYSKLSLTGAILNADLAGSIAYSKLTLTASIVNADIASAAAIALTKLAGWPSNAAGYLNNDGTGVLTWATPGGGGTVTGTGTSGVLARWSGTSAIGNSAGVVDADVGATAAIAYSKLSLTGHLVNADIATAAAIVYSKLALTASIVNADIASAAAIAYSKLSLTTSIVNADIATAAAIVYSKLSLSNSIVNADIASAAAIADSKLATISTASKVSNSATTATSANTASAIVARDGSGNFTAGVITASGLTGAALTARSYHKSAPTISAGTLTLDYNAGPVFYVALNANITTMTLTNWPASGTFGEIMIRFTFDGTARTIAWPSGSIFDGGVAPVFGSTNAHVGIVHLGSADALTSLDVLAGALDAH